MDVASGSNVPLVEPAKLKSLMDLLRETDKSFEQIAKDFTKTFYRPSQFRAGCVLMILIEDGLLELAQRLIAFYLIYEIYHGETNLTTTPFLPLVLDTVETSKEIIERKFLLQFLTTPSKELCKHTPLTFIATADPHVPCSIPDLDAYRRMHAENAPRIPS